MVVKRIHHNPVIGVKALYSLRLNKGKLEVLDAMAVLTAKRSRQCAISTAVQDPAHDRKGRAGAGSNGDLLPAKAEMRHTQF